MLKALELSGFKSFADKTRFEFPPGITVVVGPNGSGKSNIVDAIKWVLGEQSAKSLRGKDMSDVIFKGSSGTNSRRPANAATATIVLENSDKRFAYDADEVHVSRRVYRSGESEYLINGETTRLKDIRALFRGTGVGTDAYSLIEQGKVERMLSTNAKERRAIFEEAAGISRFKAKKIDTQRRLARVEGNLIRLADIVEEVGSRYRSVKSQASKAARYKEYSDRLQQLRTFVGLKDWRSFSEQLEKIKSNHQADHDVVQALTAEIADQENTAKEIETQLEEVTLALTQHQESAGEVRDRITQLESHLTLNQSRLHDVEQRQSQLDEQLTKSGQRTQDFQQRIETTEQESQTAQQHFEEATQRLENLESELAGLEQKLVELRTGNETKRSQYTQLMETLSQIGRAVSAGESQTKTLSESKSRSEASIAELTSALQTHQRSFDELNAEKERLQAEAETKDSVLREARNKYNELKSSVTQHRDQLNDLTNQQSGLTQRAEVIEELEQSLEGINAGAKELLRHAQAGSDGPMSDVVGLVADLVSVNVQHAAIVDVALGDIAQFVIVDGTELINRIADETIKLDGRVGLIQLDSPPTMGADPKANLNGAPGVIGRADRLVQVQPAYASFIRQLLGGTWVVKTLGDALHLQSNHPAANQVRMVTLDGEIVESDGAVVVGPKSTTAGLVSRRSELRALKRELAKLENEINDCRQQLETLTQQESQAEQEVERQINENTELASRLSEQSNLAAATEKQIKQTQTQLNKSQQELDATSTRLSELQSTLTAERASLDAKELAVAALTEQISSDDQQASQTQNQRTETEQAATAAKVKLAKAEQLLDGTQARMARYRQEYDDQLQSQQELEKQKSSDLTAIENAQSEIKTATDQLSELQTEKEKALDLLTRFTQQRTEIDAQRREISSELKDRRDRLRSAEDKIHQSTMRIEQLNMQREQLAQRLQDDYGIDIATVEETPTDQELEQREQIDAEITDLRKKIGSIGSVNLDALQELEDLEGRYLAMDEQYQDLVSAKETLEKIIARIDTDSRKLFVETLEAIRTNFQKLFRQTFGGGKADIILEPDVDPLEAGVDIVATPPGKPEFSNSLLSGGEKALTAVSLLMAIFQFRPSPFCVLDEVDAPFDEANIGRFVDVLKSFLGWTKFVIVTHSKKTMTAATTLYGITMQESGVSKRVSVKFEDVSEDGHISDEAVRRADDDAA